MSANPITTEINRVGQRYYYTPVFDTLHPKAELLTEVSVAIAEMFRRPLPEAIRVFLRHERVRLRWMKPDGKGGLVLR